jgi:Uma2 family endonuclease
LERIYATPPPGTATEADVLARPLGEKRLCELVDGVLVAKPLDFRQALLGSLLVHQLGGFVFAQDRGILLGAGAPFRLAPGLVRLPEVAFVDWKHFPNRELPAGDILDLAPDLAIEILREGNTASEMERKLREYFAAGCRLVWHVDPVTRTVRVYKDPTTFELVGVDGVLDGGEVLPGFTVSVGDWFAAGKRRQS